MDETDTTTKNEEKSKTDRLIQHVLDYFSAKTTLIKLKVSKSVATIVSGIISNLVVVVFMWLFLIFISFGTALYISERMGSTYAGHMIVAGFYLLIGLILAIFKKPLLQNPMMNSIIASIFKEEDKKDENK